MKLFNSKKNIEDPFVFTPKTKRNRPIYITKEQSSTSELPLDFSNYSNEDLRVGYSSTWKESCGIAVYTENLSNALFNQGIKNFIYSKNISVSELLSCIDRDRIHVLNIQYEPSITYSLDSFLMLASELRNRRIKLFFTFHSESPATKKLIDISNGGIFHKPPTTQNLNMDKVFIVPMGVPIFEPQESKESLRNKYGYNLSDKILTTTGFLFTWKGHAKILNKLVPFLKKDSNLKVQLLTAFNSINPAECILENKNVKNVINSNGLENQVQHIINFLPQQELNERLYISDLGYLWGALTTTSSSAASKEFITSRLPLVVTNSNHYHDINEGAIKVSIDENIFVNTIMNTDSSRLQTLREQMQHKYNKLNNNSIILKHIEIFKEK